MKSLPKKAWIGCLALFALIAWGGAGASAAQQQEAGNGTELGNPSKAVAVLHSTVGHKAYGVVIFDRGQGDQGVLVVADLGGLSPGKHLLEIHEYGDCSALDATTAGKVFNPKQKPKAGTSAEHAPKLPPVGVLGSVQADNYGHARFEVVDPRLSLNGKDSIIGRSIIVSGSGSGSRTACGVIGMAPK